MNYTRISMVSPKKAVGYPLFYASVFYSAKAVCLHLEWDDKKYDGLLLQ